MGQNQGTPVVQRQEGKPVAVFNLDASRLKIGIVVSLFNSDVTGRLLEGALEELTGLGVREENISVVRVPGSFEIPVAARALTLARGLHAVVCLGALIQGETDHYRYLAAEVSRGIGQVGLEARIPIAFGVLTTSNLEQALDRAGGRHGNKGAEAARAAVQMVQELGRLESGKVDEGS